MCFHTAHSLNKTTNEGEPSFVASLGSLQPRLKGANFMCGTEKPWGSSLSLGKYAADSLRVKVKKLLPGFIA